MTLRLLIPEAPSEGDRESILSRLRTYNISKAGDPRIRPVAILLTDENGEKVGGLWGRVGYDWLFVELLSVPAEYRGQGFGRALMQEAETIARAENCFGLWLDTYDFQARGFYEGLGFTVFGAIEDHPVGHRRFFLQKRL